MCLELISHLPMIHDKVIDRVDWVHPDDHFIEINDKENCVTFKMQKGPINNEEGPNGCQAEDLLHFALALYEELNKKNCCIENVHIMINLKKAIEKSKQRTLDRTKRGVEGSYDD